MSEARREIVTGGLPVNPIFPAWFQAIMCAGIGVCLVVEFGAPRAFVAGFFASVALMLGIVLYFGCVRTIYVYWRRTAEGEWYKQSTIDVDVATRELVLKVPVAGWFAPRQIEVIYGGTSIAAVRQGDQHGWIRTAGGEHTSSLDRIRELVPQRDVQRIFLAPFKDYRYRATCCGKEITVRSSHGYTYTFRSPDHLLAFLQHPRGFREVEEKWWACFSEVEAFEAWLNEASRGLQLGSACVGHVHNREPHNLVAILLAEIRDMAEVAKGAGFTVDDAPSRILNSYIARVFTLEMYLAAVYAFLLKTPRLAGPKDGKRLRALLEAALRETQRCVTWKLPCGVLDDTMASSLVGPVHTAELLEGVLRCIRDSHGSLQWDENGLVPPIATPIPAESPRAHGEEIGRRTGGVVL